MLPPRSGGRLSDTLLVASEQLLEAEGEDGKDAEVGNFFARCVSQQQLVASLHD